MQLSCEFTVITRLLVVELNGSCRLFLVGQTQRPRGGVFSGFDQCTPLLSCRLGYLLFTTLNQLFTTIARFLDFEIGH